LGKPDIKELVRQGYMVIDMHVHTQVSDGCSPAQSILERAKELGIGVAISDHNKIKSAINCFDNDYGVTVIPSIEVTAESGEHLLYYFETKDALKKFHTNEIKGRVRERSVNDLLKLRDKYKCLVSWAHPAGWNFFHRRRKITIDLKKIDCLEIINGHAALWNVKQTARWAQRHNNSYTGGSDVHEISQLGRVVTCAKAKTIPEFLDKVKKKQVKIIGERVDIFRFMLKYPFKIAIAKMNYFIRF